MYVMYQQHLSLKNKANTWKWFRPLWCDAVYSDNFFDIFEELTINVCCKYKVYGFRNVGTFLSFYTSSNPRRGNLQSHRLENVGSHIVGIGVAACY
jgi:hypothetical protein